MSSTEAEYMALTASAQEAMHLRALVSFFGLSSKDPTLIYEDNQGALAMSINSVLHQPSEHISIHQHFIREKVQHGDVRLEYIKTTRMIADAMTKPQEKAIFLRLRSPLMGSTHPSTLQ
jgi:hypothetical protein